MMDATLNRDRGSVVLGALLMLILSVLLFWLPGIGSLIAGIVGGKVAGSVLRGLAAAILPSLLIGAALFFGISLIGLPIVGLLAGASASVIFVAGSGMLLLGALIGGLLA
ncbi:MAG: hypothetical protein VX836_02085 [Pseudomonadota bacterium]|nr:hypothetical protein [Pseudomonadota bacterium]